MYMYNYHNGFHVRCKRCWVKQKNNSDHIIDIILDKDRQAKIDAPWRWATIAGNSPQIINLLDDTSYSDIEAYTLPVATKRMKQSQVQSVVEQGRTRRCSSAGY